jgi:membrane protease YdiL (CAAX protease family)
MLFESWALAIPLLVLGISVARWRIHAPLYASAQSWRDDAVLSLGAGVYEEVVFRLILMTAITLVAGDILRFPKKGTGVLMVAVSAILFSLYHYLGSEAFEWKSFAFRTVAGVYFAILFLTRGFGVTAGCHIAYDILVVSLSAMSAHQV